MIAITDTLVITAHPDDMELWCGAVVDHLISKGANVRLAIVSTSREVHGSDVWATREAEAKLGASILGLPEPIFLENYTGAIDFMTLFNQLNILLKKYPSKQILTHFPFDRHPDHVLVGSVLLNLFCNINSKFDLYFFPTSESYGFLHTDIFEGNADKKYEAIIAHKSQGFSNTSKSEVSGIEKLLKAKRAWHPSKSALFKDEPEALAKYASISKHDIVEIGTCFGGTTQILAENALPGIIVWSVDNYCIGTNPAIIYNDSLKKLGNSFLIVGDSQEVGKHWKKEIGFLFIDGSHEYFSAKTDLVLWSKFLVKSGIVAIHDFEAYKPGVDMLVNEIENSSEWEIIERVSSTIFARRIEA